MAETDPEASDSDGDSPAPGEGLLVSLHIPKTAGTSLLAALEEVFPEAVQRDYGGIRSRAHPLPRLEERTRCVHGHLDVGHYLDVHPGCRLMTWLRSPADRVASHYYYWRRMPDPATPQSRLLVDEDLSLLEFASIDLMRNVQTQWLNGVPLERFDFVGVTERLPELLPALCDWLGADQPQLPRSRANPARLGGGVGYPLDPWVREELTRLNSEDQRLYEEALRRIERGAA